MGYRVGGERYQQGVYEFEGMGGAQGVGEVLMGRWDEAVVTLGAALGDEDGDWGDVDAIANLIVVEGLMGRKDRVGELMGVLERMMPRHELLVGLEEKGRLFDDVAERYSPKVAMTA